MQNKTTCETQRSGATDKCVQRLGRRPPLSNGSESNLAIDKQNDAMSESLSAAQDPSQVSNHRNTLLNVDVVGRLNTNRKDNVEVAKLKLQVVAWAKTGRKFGGQHRAVTKTNMSPSLAGHARDLAHLVNTSLSDDATVAVDNGRVGRPNEWEKR